MWSMLVTSVGMLAAGTPEWTLIAGGDTMLNGVKPSAEVFRGVAPVLRKADLVYANLEIPLTNARTATTRKSAAEVRARSQYILKASPEHARYLADAGFDFLSLGNNHAFDYGMTGYLEMEKGLRKHGFAFTGAGPNQAVAERVVVRTVGERYRVGMISYLSFLTQTAMNKCDPAGPKDPGVATLTLNGASGARERRRLEEIVKRAKRECDFLMVALHWGQERQPQPREYQVSLGRLFIEAGADLVLGAHPHVLQPGELYRGKPIVYSLGNLVSARGGSTAMVEFQFEGPKMRAVRLRPVTLGPSRVRWTTGAAAKRALSTALAQESAFRRRFRSSASRPLLGAGYSVESTRE